MALENFVNGTMLNKFAKLLKLNIKSDLLGGKKLKYMTQAEYDLLTDDEKNDENIIYNITDADIPDYVTQEELNAAIEENGFSGDYNDLENRPCYETPGIDTKLYIPMPTFIDENDLFNVPSLTDKNGKSIYSNDYYIAHRGPFDMEWFAEAKIKVDYSRMGYKAVEIEFNNGWDDLNWNRFNFDNYKYSDNAYILTVPDPYDEESVMPYAAFVLEDTVFTGMRYDYDIGEIVEKSVTLPQGVYLIDLGENGVSGPMTNVGLKQLDEKFIPDTIVRTKDLEDVAYSGDYNDLENRPCYQDLKPDFTMPIVPSSGYYKVFTGEYTLLGDYYNVNDFGEVISRDVEDYKHAIYTYKLDGKTCTLDLSTINFEDYRVSPNNDQFKITTILENWNNAEVELLYITDISLATTKENKKGETVDFTYSTGATVVSISELIQPVSLTNIGTIKQLDEKFIPDTIATKVYVDNAVAENGSSGDYNDLINKPTIPTVTNDLTDILKSNYDIAYNHSQAVHAPSDAQKNSDITKAEIENKLTGNITSHTHNQYLTEHQSLENYALKSEIPTDYITSIPSEYITETELNNKGYLTEHQDISGKADKTELHDHSNKTVLDEITSAKVTEWDNKSTFSGSYNDLKNKPTIPSVDSFASKQYVDEAISDLVDTAPDALNTLNELAKAIDEHKDIYEPYVEGINTALSNKADSSQLGGLTLMMISQTEYDALLNKDDNTLYIIK